MTVSEIVFCGVTAFSLLLFMFYAEMPSLVLLFSSINALVAAFFGASLTLSSAVLVISFFVIFTVSVSVLIGIDKFKKRKSSNKTV